MYLPGHVTVAYLVGRHREGARVSALVALAPVIFGALLPDLIDKPVFLLRLSPHGRTVGHAYWIWGFLAALWMIAWARRLRRADWLGGLVLGGVSHLLTDLVDDLVDGFQTSGYAWSTWGLWPWLDADDVYWRVPHLLPRSTSMVTVLEVATVLGTCAWLVLRRRGARR